MIGCSTGLEILNPADGSVRREFLAGPHGVEALLEGPDRQIWLGTASHGLDQYVPGTGFIEHRNFLEQSSHDTMRHILSLCRDRSGNLWIGTGSGGIAKFSRHARNLLIYTADPDDSFSLPFPSVQSILEDARGRLWVGGYCGLACSRDSGGELRRFQAVEIPGVGPGGACIRALSEDPVHPGEALWIGLDNAGLWKFDIASGLATPALDVTDPHHPQNAGSVSALAWDRDGRLWVGTAKGLFIRPSAGSTIARIELGSPPEAGPVNVSCLLVDRFHSVWVGTEDQGLFRLDPRPGQPPMPVRFTASLTNPASLSDDRITSIHEDPRGTIWVGTFGGGVNRFDRAAGSFQRLTTHDGLLSNVIHGIFSDDNGTLWLATREGLSNLIPGRHPPLFRNFSTGDGLQKNLFNDNACGRGRNGWLFFGGLSGLTAFQPAAIRPNLEPPPVAVTDFKIFNWKDESPVNARSGGSITLDYQDARFSFEFTALDFTNPGKNRFAYRLRGMETRWTYADASHRSAVFYKPAPGDYVFQVRAANSDDVWNDAGWSLPVTIWPPFYRSGWFLSLVALGTLALAAVTVRLAVRRYQKKSAERLDLVNTMVEISETERQRIGLELHDNLSHDLVAIAVQCRLLAKKNPGLAVETSVIEEKIKAAIQQTRSIARGLFPLALAQNGLPAMLDEIRYMVEKDYQIPCEASLDQEIQVEDLRTAAHLYYIAREAMLNAARHSGTDRMFIGLRRVADTIVLMVRDYGRGTGAAHPGHAGMGLKIMEYRARLIGGHFEIRQPDDGGTEIVCTAPRSTEQAHPDPEGRE